LINLLLFRQNKMLAKRTQPKKICSHISYQLLFIKPFKKQVPFSKEKQKNSMPTIFTETILLKYLFHSWEKRRNIWAYKWRHYDKSVWTKRFSRMQVFLETGFCAWNSMTSTGIIMCGGFTNIKKSWYEFPYKSISRSCITQSEISF
jgi:hypothetical protein